MSEMDVCFRKILRYKFTICLSLIVFVYILYNVVNSYKTQTFSEISSSYRKTESGNEKLQKEHVGLSDNTRISDKTKHKSYNDVNVMITFTKAKDNYQLQEKFKTTVRSLFHFATIPVKLHILGDSDSERIAEKILSDVVLDKSKYSIIHLDVDSLAKQAHNIISEMQKYFSYRPGAYYSDALFFVSIVLHRVQPDLHKVIMLDADLKFDADIKDLYALFDQFTPDNIIGIGRDLQPVYRHNFHMYRNQHKDTRIGAPPPDGLTGFNSGVLLLNLDRMRQSMEYNSLISADKIKELTEKYLFKGHLGDQDFFSLILLEHESLFYVLPCTWNRQLCEWWRKHGYADVFDEYFTCEGHINVYHGNCNTKIPKLDWET